MTAGSPGPGTDRQRQHSQYEGERGHDDRAEPQARRLARRFQQILAIAVHVCSELHDQDRVLGSQAHEGDQADLQVQIGIDSAQPHGQEGAEHGERHGEDHGKRQRQALVLRGQDQKHHEHRQRKQRRRVLAAGLLLERLARPGQLIAVRK